MPDADVRIFRDGDPPIWTDLGSIQPEDFVHLGGDAWKVVVIEGGMASRLPSVALRLDLPDGKVVVAETSLAIFISIMAVARGAFPEAFVGGPFEAR